MAAYTYQHIGDAYREQITAMTPHVMLKSLPPHIGHLGNQRDDEALLSQFSHANLREDLRHGVYVVAMRDLGIRPAVHGERWRRLPNSPNVYVSLDVDARKDAQTYLLKKHGIDVSQIYSGTVMGEEASPE